MPRLDGYGHIVLVVSDLRRSVDWYRRVFGFVVVREGVKMAGFNFTSLLHPESHAFVGLARVEDGESAPYDDYNIGLQHYGYHVPERSDLIDWAEHLDSLQIEHSGIVREGYGSAIRFRDPDNIVLEVFWADRRFFALQLAKATRRSAHAAQNNNLPEDPDVLQPIA